MEDSSRMDPGAPRRIDRVTAGRTRLNIFFWFVCGGDVCGVVPSPSSITPLSLSRNFACFHWLTVGRDEVRVP